MTIKFTEGELNLISEALNFYGRLIDGDDASVCFASTIRGQSSRFPLALTKEFQKRANRINDLLDKIDKIRKFER